MTIDTRTTKNRGSIQIAFGVGVIFLSIGVLGALVYPQRELLISYEWDIHWGAIGFTFGIYTITLLMVSLTWGAIMDAVGGNLPWSVHSRVYLVSHLARRLPGTIWYVASRVVLYKGFDISARLIILASGMEILVMMVSGIIISLIFATSIMVTYGVGYGWFIAFALVSAGLLHPRTLRFLLRRTNVELPTSIQFRKIINWIVFYICVWCFGGLILYSISNIVANVSVANIPYLIGCWSIVGVISTMFFFLPSNFGVTEVGLSLLLTAVVPSPIAVVIALLVRLLLIVFEIFWAIIIVGINKRRVII